jgi:hypothetical protein
MSKDWAVWDVKVEKDAQVIRRTCLELMQDEAWHPLHEFLVACDTECGTASITARIRDLRKKQFGEHNIVSRSKGAKSFEYRLVPGIPVPRRNSVSRLLEDLAKLIATNTELRNESTRLQAELEKCLEEIVVLRKQLALVGAQ